ncbi:hypothetical protein MUP35_02345, partial [Patescibacteria group bacterium]|nr:hypothetical protein [Patescibacteria group bacterium]
KRMNPVEIEYLRDTYPIGIIMIALFLLAVLIIYLRDKRFKWLILALILVVFLLGGGIWSIFQGTKRFDLGLLIAGEALVISAIVLAGCLPKITKLKLRKGGGEDGREDF